MPARGASIDEVIDHLVPMFLEDTEHKLEYLEVLAERMPRLNRRSEEFLEFVRTIHTIKGGAPSFGFPFLGVICHKLEDYLAGTPHFSPKAVVDIKTYLARIGEIIERRTDPSENAGFELFKTLPSSIDFDQLAFEPKSLHSLFIGPRDVQFRILETELKACGIRSMISANSFHGVELAARTKPDFIMVANVVDILSGTEVVHMLRALKALQHTPIMFLRTEVPNDHQQDVVRRALPDDVQIVRKGRHFSEDFADALTTLRVL